jgi:hypothetical protein
MNKLLNLRHWDFKPINYFIPNAKTYLKTCFLIKIFINQKKNVIKNFHSSYAIQRLSLFSDFEFVESEVRERII